MLIICGGNVTPYYRLLEKFWKTERDFVSRFRKTRRHEGDEAAERMAHTLKGVAGNIGASQVYSDTKSATIKWKVYWQPTVAFKQ